MVDISVGVGVGNEVNGTAGRGGGAVALKGLRLLSIDRGADGFGFHMFTNKELKVCGLDSFGGQRAVTVCEWGASARRNRILGVVYNASGDCDAIESHDCVEMLASTHSLGCL